MVGGHVPEGGGWGRVQGPPLGQHDYLRQLSPGGGVVGFERVVRVARDHARAVQVVHGPVEEIAGLYVGEGHRAGGGAGRGGGGRGRAAARGRLGDVLVGAAPAPEGQQAEGPGVRRRGVRRGRHQRAASHAQVRRKPPPAGGG